VSSEPARTTATDPATPEGLVRGTELTRTRYDRIAPLYDALEWTMELTRFRSWWQALWAQVHSGERVLELGVGTGKNIPCYPVGADMTAVDLSERMLSRAHKRATRRGVEVALSLEDAQALSFPDASFDAVVATFVFCSVPDPVLGLAEARRVLRPGGRLLLLEHVLSEKPILRSLMRWLDPIPVHIWGAHIDRETIDNVRRAGFVEVRAEDLSMGIVKSITARAPFRFPTDADAESWR